jgi:hypothetical protein
MRDGLRQKVRTRQSHVTAGKMTAPLQGRGETHELVLQVLALTAVKTLSEPEWLQRSPSFQTGAAPLPGAHRWAFWQFSFVSWCLSMEQFPR